MLRKTEEMLIGYIQQRKKPLAQLALESLLEIAPGHPRRQEYQLWVNELDQELALQKRIDEQFQAGHLAVHRGDLDIARTHLESLEKLNADAQATATLAQEISDAQHDVAASADIERLKQQVEDMMTAGQLDQAQASLAQLARLAVPKVTVDSLAHRLADARVHAQEQAEAQTIEGEYRRRLEARDWQGARDVAHRFGERFPSSNRGAELFNLVGRHEAMERRQNSLRQGIAALEQMIAQGRRQEAELALKLLHNLELPADQLAALEQRVKAL